MSQITKLLFGPEHYKIAATNIMKKIWGRFVGFGTFIAGCSGIYFLVVGIKIIITQCISTYSIFKVAGFTWKLILGICQFCAKFVIFKHHNDIIKSMQRERNHQGHRINRNEND